MKALVYVTPKREVLDPQGKAIERACHSLGYAQVTGVRQGKLFELEFAPSTEQKAAAHLVRELSEKLLSNPVIEDFRIVEIAP
ncbi:MAG TPA: phosphoribosylformylglycinamidine synthase subunit PurS [Myxococcota bacterium]|nr:phosphoribosylformylglycinamidine synthase subunit PurS [Myxococcota bacterium]